MQELYNVRVTILLLVFISIVAYLPVSNGFFAQDEWYAFGIYINKGYSAVINGLIPGRTHYVPLTHILNFITFSKFGLAYQYHAILSITLHAIASVIVYLFIKEFTQNRPIALMTGLLFVLSTSAHQATSWVFADTSNHGALIFSVLGSWIFLHFLKTEKWLIGALSVTCLLLSILFKEITLGVFVWLGYLAFIKARSKRFAIKASAFVLIGAALYITVRSLGIYFQIAKEFPSTYLRNSSEIAYSALTLPIKAIAQSIIPGNQMYRMAYGIANQFKSFISANYGTTAFDLLVEDKFFEPLNFIVFILIIYFLVIMWVRDKSLVINLALPALGWTFINSLIYILAPGKYGVIHEIESRNLYLPAIGIMLYISIFIKFLTTFNRKYSFLFGLYFIFLLFSLNGTLSKIVFESRIRERILRQIKSEYPLLSNKTVFYTESDKSFYGLPDDEKLLPFQSGLGQTLMVWYQDSHKFPKDFFKDDYLWDMASQDYKEIDNVGFGYFRDYEKLKVAILQYKLPINSVIGYRYDSELNKLEDMTDEVRGRLAGALSKKSVIPTYNFSTTASHYSQDAKFAVDGDMSTKWDSHLAYKNAQYFQINLSQPTQVGALEIDSSTDKNQDKVGYKVLLSQDETTWQDVFYSKRDPPGDNGIVRLTFLPTLAKYVRIEQVGSHKFSSWVIYELKVYETFN